MRFPVELWLVWGGLGLITPKHALNECQWYGFSLQVHTHHDQEVEVRRAARWKLP